MSGIPIWAVRGAKVVCVSNWGGHTDWYLPHRSEIYTIEVIDPAHQYGAMLGLAEITRPATNYWFPVNCFRPLITQQDDIEVHFRALLDAPAKVEA